MFKSHPVIEPLSLDHHSKDQDDAPAAKKRRKDGHMPSEALFNEPYPTGSEVVAWLNSTGKPICMSLLPSTGKGHHATVASTVRKARQLGCTMTIEIYYNDIPIGDDLADDLLESRKFEQVFGIRGIHAHPEFTVESEKYGKLKFIRGTEPHPPTALSINFNYRQRPSITSEIQAGLVPNGWWLNAWLASGDNKRLYTLHQGSYEIEEDAAAHGKQDSVNTELYHMLLDSQAKGDMAMQIVYGIHYSTKNAADRMSLLQSSLSKLYERDDFVKPIVCVIPRKTDLFTIMSKLKNTVLADGSKVEFDIVTSAADQKTYLRQLTGKKKQNIAFFIVDEGFSYPEFQDLMHESALPPVVEYNAYYECLFSKKPHLKSAGFLCSGNMFNTAELKVSEKLYNGASTVMEVELPELASQDEIIILTEYLYQCYKKEREMMELFEELGTEFKSCPHAFELLLTAIGQSFPDKVRPFTSLQPLNVDESVRLNEHFAAAHQCDEVSVELGPSALLPLLCCSGAPEQTTKHVSEDDLSISDLFRPGYS